MNEFHRALGVYVGVQNYIRYGLYSTSFHIHACCQATKQALIGPQTPVDFYSLQAGQRKRHWLVYLGFSFASSQASHLQ